MTTAVDVTTDLDAAAARRRGWTRERARALAGSLSARVPGSRVDWDDDAGEEWALVLVDEHFGEDVVALVRIRVPLVLVRRAEADCVRDAAAAAVVIVLDDLDTTSMRAAPRAVRDAFPEREPSPTLDYTDFSAMDLWYATT